MTTKKEILIGTLIIGIVLVGGLGAFASAKKPLPFTEEIPKDLYIKMVERGTYVASSVELEVKSDGSITYQKTEGLPKEIIEKKTGRINEARIKTILSAFYENNFFAWNGKYFNDPDKPPDLTVTEITLHFDGKKYSVSEYAGSGPKPLHEIEGMLRELMAELEKE